MRAASLVAAVVVGVGIACGVYYRRHNPEKVTLDAAARQTAGGSYVTLADGVTHYQVGGPESGVPVVLVHGFSVPSYIWDSTYIALTAAGYRVLRYDLFGRGMSDRPKVDYTPDLFDGQLGELLDSLRVPGPVHLVGLSYGGVVTGTFAGRHPERVRSLTLVDPAAGDREPLSWYLRLPGLGPLLWQMLAVPGMAQGQLSDFVEPARWPDWPDRYRPQMRYRGFGRALWSTALVLGRLDLDSLYATVGRQAFPVQLIWGTEDHTVPIANSERVRKAIPRIQYHPIERAGHLPHMERTDLVNPILLGFLRSVDSAATMPKGGGTR